jgi:hypothetical protein
MMAKAFNLMAIMRTAGKRTPCQQHQQQHLGYGPPSSKPYPDLSVQAYPNTGNDRIVNLANTVQMPSAARNVSLKFRTDPVTNNLQDNKKKSPRTGSPERQQQEKQRKSIKTTKFTKGL